MKFTEKYQKPLFVALTIFTLTILFVMSSFPVHAESNSALPYYVESDLPFDLDTALQEIFTDYPTIANITYSDALNADNYIVRRESPLDATGYIYYTIYLFIDSNSYSVSLSNNNYDTFTTSDTVTITGYGYGSNYGKFVGLSYTYKPWAGKFMPDGYTDNNDSPLIFTLVTNGQSDFRPKSIKKPFLTYDGDVVFTNQNSDDVVDIRGHSSPTVNDSGHYIDDGNGNRIPKPNKPTPSVYTPPTIQYPTVDTSTLETLVESLIDLVQYFISYIGGVINGWFSNLLSNLDSWFDYVVQSFNFAINNVVGAIKDLAETFYNNMVSLFEPLYVFFNGVSTFFNNLIQLGIDGDSFSFSIFFYNLLVPDPEDFADALLDGDIHHVVPLVSSVHTKFVSLFNSFSNLTPSKVLVLPSFIWHNQTFNLSIDFSWYDDYKVYGDTIISGFLIIGYIYWFVLQLSSMFRGGNSIGHDVAKVGGQH